ncbi:MAG: hypothetical protein J6D52_08065 [Clostridia bacterium]|nr:hypothetical protein [Clostridia bacterium]
MFKSGTVLGKVNNTDSKVNVYKPGTVLGKVNNTTEENSLKVPHYIESRENQAEKQAATDFLFSQLPTGDVSKDIKNHQEQMKAKTTIPSVEYDEGFATEQKLRYDMDTAKKDYESAKKNDDRNIFVKGLDYLGGIDGVSVLKNKYNDAKQKYETYKSQRTENQIQQTFGITGDEYVERLKDLKKNAKTDAEKEKYKIKLQQTKKDLYGESNVWDFIKDNVKTGFLNLNKQVNDSTNLIFGKVATALGFEDNIFGRFKAEADSMQQNAAIESNKTNKYLGTEFLGEAVQATTAAVPDAVYTTALTLMTGGGYGGAQLLGDAAIKAANPTITYNLGNAIKETVKSPIFYTSFINELGGKYEEAKADGASEEQAIFDALLTSAINARLEMGGFQALPEKLVATKGAGKKLWQYFTSSLGEGTEEVSQRIASGLADIISYDKDKEIFSPTNTDAVVHPESMFKEFVMGTIVGSVLGGGQLTINGIINASTQSQYKTIGKAAISTTNIQDIIDYSKSAINDDIRYIARNVTAKNIADEDAGRLYQYTVRSINEKFEDVYTEADFDEVINEYFSGDISKSIKNIASSAFANKLVEMNIEPEQNDAYRKFTTDSSFAKQVDDVVNGVHDVNYDLYVSETPKVFTDIGFSNSALLMRNSKVNEILEKHPEMSVDSIKQIPQAIENPILILKSKTHPTESVVAITDIQTDKGNMIVPVWVNQSGNYIDIELGETVHQNTNFVASAYGRDVKSLIEYANENDGFLYQNEDI